MRNCISGCFPGKKAWWLLECPPPLRARRLAFERGKRSLALWSVTGLDMEYAVPLCSVSLCDNTFESILLCVGNVARTWAVLTYGEVISLSKSVGDMVIPSSGPEPQVAHFTAKRVGRAAGRTVSKRWQMLRPDSLWSSVPDSEFNLRFV